MKTARDVVPMIRIVELRRERQIGIFAVEVIPSGDGFEKDPSVAKGELPRNVRRISVARHEGHGV